MTRWSALVGSMQVQSRLFARGNLCTIYEVLPTMRTP